MKRIQAVSSITMALALVMSPALAEDTTTVFMNIGNAYTDIPITVTEESVVDIIGDAETPLITMKTARIDPFLFIMKDNDFIAWDDNSANDPILNYGGARIVKTLQIGDYVIRATYSLANPSFPTTANGSYVVRWSVTPIPVVIPEPLPEQNTPALESATVVVPVSVAVVVKKSPTLKKKQITAPLPKTVEQIVEQKTFVTPIVEPKVIIKAEPLQVSDSSTATLVSSLMALFIASMIWLFVWRRRKRK